MGKTYKWMPVLRTGTFIDKNNKKVTFDESHLDKIIANTDLTKEPQLVVEHPTFDKLGFGTISALKRVGEYLFALPKEVNEKFKSSVNAGELPGRSVCLEKDSLALSSIGFLPPEIPPAVDGLGSYAFSSDATTENLTFSFPGAESHFAEVEGDKYEFQRYEVSKWTFERIRKVLRGIKNYIIEKEGIDKANEIINEYDLDDTGNPPSVFEVPENTITGTIFSQTINNGEPMKIELSKITDQALRAAVEKLIAELEDTKVKLSAAQNALSAKEIAETRAEVLAFCESDEMRKKILPAEKEKVVCQLMAAKNKGKLEFSSGDKKEEFDGYELLKEQLRQLPDKIELSELANNESASSQSAVPEYKKTGDRIANYVK